ncbi:MAG: Putative periplasmic protein [uncultured Sulfurovum sp.]|uniref:Periplasmic protein n=1 Tax=uncultured Sulfurovum sp. TaxID=269237 RepID=A0A6S6S536_9BACT|nr:MAG: Putative periplasmic protein [uncultured Sulfurovum sp.]
MKIFLYLVLSFSLLFSASVESKIKQNKKQLKSKKIQYNKMDKELSEVAKKINIAKKEQKKLAIKLSKLATNIQNNEVVYKRLQNEDKKYSTALANLSTDIDKNQKRFLDLVAKNFSLALALEELKQPTKDSVMMKEAYKLYAEKNSKEIEKLKVDISKLESKKETLKLKKSNIKKAISRYELERKEYKSKKNKQDVLVKNLARDKAIYKKRFNKIKASRKSLERKLAKLKIIKRSNDKERKARVVAQRTNASRPKTPKSVSSTPARAVNYSGGKANSPLRGARLIKKFGTYIDPIYKFKIFNKSITLKAPHAGSKVRSVLAGKVVFAENSGGMLGKVVIVEHANDIHTIYAKLSRLAPGIHVGKRLSAGTIIGKVDKSLMFEVTKNNKHMNPLKLIRL